MSIPKTKNVDSCIGLMSKHAMYLKKKGHIGVIVGDKNHPEVKSVLSYLDKDGIVLQEPLGFDKKGGDCKSNIYLTKIHL